ncbi:histidine kinase-like ATPase [Cercophora newfieldiana]|uniref:Histidine kinase-like ATPase n=1 Tax=Cercophora newfieldiana TaxID=92897 RepID=A0AA40D0H1_9PEZI|nr:histidine kinase-like ATPase [Cercophora newfieldiana]
MVISPLSEDDTRKLGATLAIATPVILIKELFENALDSGATTVVVLISPNTVDRIEVRDNGHGIDPSDFDALGRSGYTSKLKSLHELATVGARSLGFRGVALASINTLAEVTITTRTSSQPVAEVLRLVDGGGIVKEGRAGNPVGTAVCANNLFANFPVRQRSVIKEAHKNLAKIKELLQAYTFARSGTKVAFRVFGKPESTWCYTAQTGGGVKEAARQLFGHDVASRCSLKTYSADIKEPREQEKTGAGKSLSFEGFLPHAGADPQKIAGAFFSVDSRPLSPIRGTGKKLLSVFRAHYNQFPPGTKEEKATKGILIRLNIVCPPGSYDVNVEPAKDDVIFVDEEWVIGHFKQYLLSVYPRKEDDYENEGGRGYTTAGLETPPASSSGPKDTCKPIQDGLWICLDLLTAPARTKTATVATSIQQSSPIIPRVGTRFPRASMRSHHWKG